MTCRVNNGRFSVLPDEVCLRVLHYLPAGDVCRCMQVCRRWHVLCNDASLWTQIEIACRYVSCTLLSRLVSTRPRLRSLVFLSHMTERLSGWGALGDCWSQLHLIESITFVACPSVVLDTLPSIVKYCPLLKCIRCECTPSFTREHFLGLMRYEHLYTELSLAHCTQMDDVAIYFAFQALDVAKRLSCLQTLNLDGLGFLTDIGTLAILETCPQLINLDLDGEMVTDRTGLFIGQNLTHLEHLGISFCNHLTDESLRSFSALQKLHSLRLKKGSNFTHTAFEYLFTQLTGSENLKSESNPRMHTLELMECQNLNDSSLQLIANRFPNLHHLVISWCYQITDVGMEAIAYNCEHVVTLKLVGLKYARCEPILLAPLTKLMSLDLSQTDLVDDTQLHRLKTERPWLIIINYYGDEVEKNITPVSSPVNFSNSKSTSR